MTSKTMNISHAIIKKESPLDAYDNPLESKLNDSELLDCKLKLIKTAMKIITPIIVGMISNKWEKKARFACLLTSGSLATKKTINGKINPAKNILK